MIVCIDFDRQPRSPHVIVVMHSRFPAAIDRRVLLQALARSLITTIVSHKQQLKQMVDEYVTYGHDVLLCSCRFQRQGRYDRKLQKT